MSAQRGAARMQVDEHPMGVALEMLPDRSEFPCGLPDHVDADTRLYRVGAARINGVLHDCIITRYDRECDRTEAYLTAHGWDFSRHGPLVDAVCGCKGRAAHRKVMARAGYEVRSMRDERAGRKSAHSSRASNSGKDAS